jgi:hypothetical protein
MIMCIQLAKEAYYIIIKKMVFATKRYAIASASVQSSRGIGGVPEWPSHSEN